MSKLSIARSIISRPSIALDEAGPMLGDERAHLVERTILQ
jgi:hypothetical protein